jgi:hypothetical protein
MNVRSPFSLPRRRVLAAGLGALALAVPQTREASARFIRQRGMSGGGLAQIDGSEEPRLANFGLFASAVQLPDGTALVLGRVHWIEAGTDLQLRSIEVTECVPMETNADGAQVRGRMQVNGEGDYPFVIRAMDSGNPGSALDRIEIEINTDRAREGSETEPSDDDFEYLVTGSLIAGDIQWVVADIELDA